MSSATTTDGQEIPDADELYCPHCGEITPKGGQICGHCGGPLHADATKRIAPAKLRNWGLTAAGFAYVLTPLLFAPVAFYCGVKLRRYDEEAGMKIIGAAIGAIVAWLILVQFVV